jgi:hypothetical protein
MKKIFVLFIVSIGIFNCCQCQQNKILKVEFKLSAFGVESDSFPSISGYVDFVKDSNNFFKSYYNPAIKSSSYKLSSDEIKNILQLLQNTNLDSLKKEYSIGKTDQPTSIIKVYTNIRTYSFKDYGLEGESPLKDLYKIVYRINN